MTFPGTQILDNFNRSNEGPPPSSSWSNDTKPSFPWNGMIVVDNQCAAELGSSECISFWNDISIGPDCEVYVKVPALDSGLIQVLIGLRIGSLNSTTTGYALVYLHSSSDLVIQRQDNGSTSNLATDSAFSLSAGDWIGLSAEGSSIKAYHKPAAGSWSEVLSTTDATYSTSGYLVLGAFDGATKLTRLDDFGGGEPGVERLIFSGDGIHSAVMGKLQ